MKHAFLIGSSLLAGASPVLAQSRFPDFRAKCAELAQSYHGVDSRSETISFRNFQGQQQNLEIRLKLKDEGCKYYPDSASFIVEKLGGAKVEIVFDVTINRDLTGDDRVRVTSLLFNCDHVSPKHLLKKLMDDGVVVNQILETQVNKHIERDFCPVLLEGVRKSIVSHLKTL